MRLTLHEPTAATFSTLTEQHHTTLTGRLKNLTRIFAVAFGNGAPWGAIVYLFNPSGLGAVLVVAAVTALTFVELVLLKSQPVYGPGNSGSSHSCLATASRFRVARIYPVAHSHCMSARL